MQFFFTMGFILNIKERGTKLTLQTLGGDLYPSVWCQSPPRIDANTIHCYSTCTSRERTIPYQQTLGKWCELLWVERPTWAVSLLRLSSPLHSLPTASSTSQSQQNKVNWSELYACGSPFRCSSLLPFTTNSTSTSHVRSILFQETTRNNVYLDNRAKRPTWTGCSLRIHFCHPLHNNASEHSHGLPYHVDFIKVTNH